MNPDVLWFGPNPLEEVHRAWSPDEMDALLLCVPSSRTHATQSSGDFSIDAQGRVSREGGFTYGGVQIIKTNQLSAIEQETFSLNVLWDQMIAEGRCFATVYPGHWCDVGHPGAIDRNPIKNGWKACGRNRENHIDREHRAHASSRAKAVQSGAARIFAPDRPTIGP
jgi:hypothetical protein